MSGPARTTTGAATAPAGRLPRGLSPSHGGETVLQTRDLTVGYPGRTLLRDLSLRLPSGRLTCLLGPNGSGKTTLLRTLAGMLPPLGGEVRLLGAQVSGLPAAERARRLAMVLTGAVDTGLLRAIDLVRLGRYPHTGWGGQLRARDHEAVAWAMAVTGAERYADRSVSTLSDGERQRVLIARALAQEPRVLALDEPTAFVDMPRRTELGDLLGFLARDCGLAVLMTTHDLDLALRSADDVWLLVDDDDGDDGGGGRLVAGGPEDLALSGAIGQAFHSAEVSFDVARGRFVQRLAPREHAHVSGSGARAEWTRRALERAGFGLAAAGQGATLAVTVAEDHWRVEAHGAVRRLERLSDLVEHARAHLHSGA